MAAFFSTVYTYTTLNTGGEKLSELLFLVHTIVVSDLVNCKQFGTISARVDLQKHTYIVLAKHL